MAGSLNVNRNVEDTFYRYKMPRLLAKVEGKGNGIKTVIVNMTDIAKALNRPPMYPTKYFGCELGAQTQVDNKNDRYIVNGDHDGTKLQDLLDGFIKKFVLCPNCDNPETNLVVRKNIINQSCLACGHAGTIESKHRLIQFIVKNPPDMEDGGKGETGRKGKGKGRRGKNADDSPQDETDGDVLKATNGVAAEEGSDDTEGGEQDEDWADNPDDEAQRQQDLIKTGGQLAKLTLNPDLDLTVDERLDMFMSFVKKQQAGDFDNRAVLLEAERLDIRDRAVLILCRLILDDTILQQVKPTRNLFLRFTHESAKAQKYLLGGLEQLMVEHHLQAKVAHILKAFYDEDILDEEVLIEWGKKSSKRYVSKEENKEIRDKAEPFLTWLEEAEEESSEDDDDDVEIVYGEEKEVRSVAPVPKKPAQDDDADDLDIDDI